jgi:hypothetical protein
MKIFGDSVEEIVGGIFNKVSIQINKNSSGHVGRGR